METESTIGITIAGSKSHEVFVETDKTTDDIISIRPIQQDSRLIDNNLSEGLLYLRTENINPYQGMHG